METVLEYLEAIGATLSDLERELDGSQDPIDREQRAMDERIASDPAFRIQAAELRNRYQTAQLPDLLELIAEAEARQSSELSAVQARLSRLEDELLDREDLAPNGTEDD